MSAPSLASIAQRLAMSEDELRELLQRVDAAALPAGSDGWIELIAPGCDATLRADLEALRQANPKPQAPWTPDRVAAVRGVLKDRRVDGFLVPQADPHMGEYIPARHHRLAWLTGFTGSAGLAVLHREAAALFVDGRYTLQASEQVDGAVIEARHFQKPPAKDWLSGRVKPGERIGYDPKLFSIRQADDWKKALEKKGAELVPLAPNPIDECWGDQPPEPLSPMVPHDIAYSGESLEDKCSRLGDKLKEDGLDATVLNQLDSIAWLLNVRGNDVAHTPLSVSYVVLNSDGTADLYVDRRKLAPGLAEHLGNRVSIFAIEKIESGLAALGERGAKVGLAADTATDWLRGVLEASGAEVELIGDVVELPRAVKNDTERAGTRAAHRRDAAAVARFLKWLSEEAPKGGLSELDVVARLEHERARIELHRGPSFDTISGAGPHGAIVHYRVTPESNAKVAPGSLLLVDSGAQYLDGTTDITRTVAVGTPPEGAAEEFTLVLKGHIALARAQFPQGTTGTQLDTLARQFLWQRGLNFDHGTGHGVGCYLGVHEGPQRISPAGTTKLQPGMILSNEPGFYRQGAYGIRIENLVLVRESSAFEGFLEFETITFAPIDRALIRVELLDAAERAWLDAYHAEVLEIVDPQLDPAERSWLEEATAPL